MDQHPNPTSTSNAPIFRNIKAQKLVNIWKGGDIGLFITLAPKVL